MDIPIDNIKIRFNFNDSLILYTNKYDLGQVGSYSIWGERRPEKVNL